LSASPAERAFDEGAAHLAAGRPAEAVEAYRRALAAAPGNPAIHVNLSLALRRAGDLAQSAHALVRAERLVPRHEKIMTTLLDVVAEWANAGGGMPAPPIVADASTPISIVACSIDGAKEAAMRARYGTALARREHDIVVIRDARSLAEGYARGLAQARHGLVVFSHDDVELLGGDPFGALAAALRDHDVVGLAGATRITGPAVAWAGHPHLHGWIAYPAESGLDATAYSMESGVVAGAQGLDGLLFAARREAATRVGFDAATFDGFHFYDLDFSYRAHRAGLRVAIAPAVAAVHQSRGRFDEAWKRYAARFHAKFPDLAGAPAASRVPSARVRDREALSRFYDTLRALAAAA
jgi:GT2 family glycosyltransferase